MHYKTLFSLFLFSHLWQTIVLGAANHDEEINKLLTKPTIKILEEKRFDISLSNAITAKIPENGPINEEQKKYIKLLPKCDRKAVGYGDCVNYNIELIMDEFSNTLTYDNILNLKYLFNKVLSTEIVNYISKNMNNFYNSKDIKKKKHLTLLLKCDPDAKGYTDYITNNIEFIMKELTDTLTYENILNTKYRLTKILSQQIVNDINKHMNDWNEALRLLLICDSEETGYANCIIKNIGLIMEKLTDTLTCKDILNLKYDFNQVLSTEIINYINKNQENDNNKKHLACLLKCHPKAEGYKKCINNNIELIMKELTDSFSYEAIVHIPQYFNTILSEQIVNYINTKKNEFDNSEDKEKNKTHLALLLQCHPDAGGYTECIEDNIGLIIKELTDTLTYEAIVHIPHYFNTILAEQIVNYINIKKNKFDISEDKEKNKKHLALLLKCHPDAEGYTDYITNNIELIMEGLTNNLTYENILNLQYDFNLVISEKIVNYISNTKGNIATIKDALLLLFCYTEKFDTTLKYKYNKLLQNSWGNDEVYNAKKSLLILRNTTEETANKITFARNKLIDLIKKNYIKRDGVYHKTFRIGGLLITGVSLVGLSWNNKDCLKKPYIKNILAVACLGGLALTAVSQFIHMKESTKERKKDLAEIDYLT
jgi:hypothetical protein